MIYVVNINVIYSKKGKCVRALDSNWAWTVDHHFAENSDVENSRKTKNVRCEDYITYL